MTTLPELFVQLPPNVASDLEAMLEIAKLPENPTQAEVLEVATTIATELRFSVIDVGFNGDEKVLGLIDQIPQAVVEQLFA